MGKEKKRAINSNHGSNNVSPGIVLSSGPIEATPNTVIISLNIINIDPKQTKEVIIEMKNWTTCPPEELGKTVLLGGEPLDPEDIGYEEAGDEEGVEFDPTIHPLDMLENFHVITKPLFFKIPPQMQLTVLADFPQPPLSTSNPCYEVRISVVNLENLLMSSYGVNEEFDPQVGNTVLHQQFYSNPYLHLPFPEVPNKKKS
ncbi:hypothetical protein [Bacillus sp. T3]|uniref:hypothetical protein n=1 Tax=Bacillus sp. T3 TaxID=467262 RepID=UPI0029826F1F|nr:hypothetical protein [Bacillus sp. T3]